MLDVGVGTGLQQHIEDLGSLFCQVQRHPAILVLDVGLGVGSQQCPNCIQGFLGHGQVQRRIALLVLDVGVGTGLQERVEDLGPQSCQMQRPPAVLVLDIGVGTGPQQHPDCIQGPLGYSQVQQSIAIFVRNVRVGTSIQ